MSIITMHGVNFWEVGCFNLAVWDFLESTIYRLENTLTWRPLCYRKEEVLVIQCDNNKWADNHLPLNICRCFMEEVQFWYLFMNGKLETVYRVIQLPPVIHFVLNTFLLSSLLLGKFMVRSVGLERLTALMPVFEGFGFFFLLEKILYIYYRNQSCFLEISLCLSTLC